MFHHWNLHLELYYKISKFFFDHTCILQSDNQISLNTKLWCFTATHFLSELISWNSVCLPEVVTHSRQMVQHISWSQSHSVKPITPHLVQILFQPYRLSSPSVNHTWQRESRCKGIHHFTKTWYLSTTNVCCQAHGLLLFQVLSSNHHCQSHRVCQVNSTILALNLCQVLFLW